MSVGDDGHEPTGAPDPEFAQPYVDVDEWRDVPVRHRYVHGGFTATDTRFSIYLPPPDEYRGRFFQHITPVPDSEHLAPGAVGEEDRIGFSVASGAYFLETNGGGPSGSPGSDVDPTIAAYRANAAAAQHSRAIAADMYGPHRPYGYAYGGSGGGYRTIGGAENTTGVWDGVVPYVIGSPMAIPNMFTVRMHAQRVLRHRFEQIVDAVEPGGSGDPYAGLDAEEREALAEVTRMGFPPRSWFGHRTMGMHAFPVLYGGVRMADPTYFEDFWTLPGYLGHAAPASLRRDIVRHRCEVAALVTDRDAAEPGPGSGALPHLPDQIRGGVDHAWRGTADRGAVPIGVRLAPAPDVEILGAELIVLAGEAEGARLLVVDLIDDVAMFGPGDPEVLARLRPGDAMELDNRGFLAAQTYHRHQVPTPDYPVWDQFRRPDGTPIPPQRPLLLGPLFAAAAAGTVQTGRFEGRMIVVASLLDREAVPWQADWYRTKVAEHLGDATDDHFRLWFTDNAVHGDDGPQEHPTHTISYLGVLHQALRDLSAWVEEGIAPPPTTTYEVVDGQVVVPVDAEVRGGIQPVVTLAAGGAERVEVTVGTTVTLQATAQVPDGAGQLVHLAWDLDGAGTFPIEAPVTPAGRVVAEHRHMFKRPGTWFPAVRVAAQRDGDAATPYARIQNVARVRVVVREEPTS